MKKMTKALLGYIVCTVLIAVFLFLLFATEGADAGKMKTAYAGLILLALHSCYRIYRFTKSEFKQPEVEETEKRLQEV